MSTVVISVRVPRELAEKMKRYSWVNWSEVARRGIEEYLRRLEEAELEEEPSTVLERLRRLGVSEADLEPLDARREEELRKRMVRLEWERVNSTIQAQ